MITIIEERKESRDLNKHDINLIELRKSNPVKSGVRGSGAANF